MNEIPLRQLRKLKKTVFDDYQEWDIKPGATNFESLATPTGKMGLVGQDITALIDAEIARRMEAADKQGQEPILEELRRIRGLLEIIVQEVAKESYTHF